MKTLFHIGPTEPGDGGDTLLCEWGESHCCYAVYNETRRLLDELRYLTFEQPITAREIEEIIQVQTSAGSQHRKVILCSALPQAVLVPRKYFTGTNPQLPLTNGEKGLEFFHDVIAEWQVVNAYAFPRRVHQRFGDASMIHLYTAALKTFNGFSAANQLSVDFTPRNFRVIVKKEGQLQLAQMYAYTAPLDVVYYLLKIFQELHLSKEDTVIVLSGLIDENSALYKELYNYFLNLHFAQPATISLKPNTYPPHFFTSMYNLAACVS